MSEISGELHQLVLPKQSVRLGPLFSKLGDVLPRVGRNLPMLLGLIVFSLILASSLLAPLLTPYDPIVQDVPNRLQPASIQHPLGTDHFGRDILSRLLYGSRTVLFVSLVAVGIAMVIGTTLGIVAGYYSNLPGSLIMRTMDVLLAFPLVLLSIVIVVALGPGIVNLILAISISQIPIFTRLARSLSLSVTQSEYVTAAQSIGAHSTAIIRRHILPNISSVIAVQGATAIAIAILSATALNFLGFGIQPPSPDWGAMISDFRRFIFDQPWLPFYPGVAIALTVISLNLLADGLIELLDPAHRKHFS